ncbi:MAG: DsrE family protein [Flavobacteriaceae bacterium]|nr:DsrE family protein [Flavobacteriaceae bacterium]
MNKLRFLLGICLCISIQNYAQNNRVNGEIIKGFGEFFTVENPDIKTDTAATFKVIFDVSKTSEDKSDPNKYIVTAARFLNIHADQGMHKDQLKAALTIHASAWQDVLNNKEYKEKFGVDNPNLKLIEALNTAGVDIILCGQTAVYRGLNKDNVVPSVKFALSAMTALIQYQNNGYQFIKF